MIEGKYLFVNDTLTEANHDFLTKNLHSGKAIYEVIRIINGIPLFVEDHLARLQASSKLIFGNNIVDQAGITKSILGLSVKNQIFEGNIKVIIQQDRQALSRFKADSYTFFIPHHYPTPDEYLQGYNIKSLALERPNPNAKVVNKKLTQAVTRLKAGDASINEILLVRHDGIITEGSKSNVFFVSRNEVITPAENLVLAGITREKIIAICAANQIDCVESADLKLADLPKMEGAFISGTSPKVMPVKKIDSYNFDVANKLIKLISGLYDEMISRYVNHFSHF